MKIQIDKYSYLSIDDRSFGLLSDKLEQMNALAEFKRSRSKLYNKLTPREIEILTLLAEGNNNPEIASTLGISRRTVENHRKSINRKLRIRHFRDIIKYALAFALVPFKQ
jgi:DNA-binding CsgD family transcriptional regulator